MRCLYSLTVLCICPEDDLPDVYTTTIESPRTVKVEDILEAVRPFETAQMFQEDLTASLARSLGVKVVTIGYHSGVKTVVEAP